LSFTIKAMQYTEDNLPEHKTTPPADD